MSVSNTSLTLDHSCSLSEQLTSICALPLYHIFALTVCCLMGTRLGGMNILIPNPRDMPGFIKELMKYQVNDFPAVNTLYNGLLHSPGFDKVDFSQLKIVLQEASGDAAEVAIKWGNFVNLCITFVIVAFVVWWISKMFIKEEPKA